MDNKYIKYTATTALVGIIQANESMVTEEHVERIFQEIEHHVEVYKKIRDKEYLSGIYSFLKAVDEINETEVDFERASCKKGCAHCCRINVDISEDEAILLREFCTDEKVDIDEEYLENQKNILSDERAFSEYKDCVFLDKETQACKVYEARPVACRKYFVTSNPDRCNFTKYPKSIVSVLVNLKAEIIASAVCNASAGGNMATMILKVLK